LVKRKPKQEIMSLDDFIKDWLKDHGQSHIIEEQFEKMKKDPAGGFYMPITYKGGKACIKLGLSANKVSFINLILSCLIFYCVIMAGEGHSLDLFAQQPFYGSWFFLIGLLVFFTGFVDGFDGAIARLLDVKTKSGAWLDNVIDRFSDLLMLACLIPANFLIISEYDLDFTWMIWTNIFVIFLYEYMRARHEGLGLHETKPCIGERITRIIVTGIFFVIYGISSLAVLITHLINPSLTTLWAASHYGVITWTFLIFQITLLCIMLLSSIQLGKYSYKKLKEIDKINRE